MSHNTLECPNCKTELEKAKIEGRRNIWRCPKEQTLYRLKEKRKPRNTFDPNDSTTWKARCVECGGVMDYHNYKYHCRKCSNVLYV